MEGLAHSPPMKKESVLLNDALLAIGVLRRGWNKGCGETYRHRGSVRLKIRLGLNGESHRFQRLGGNGFVLQSTASRDPDGTDDLAIGDHWISTADADEVRPSSQGRHLRFICYQVVPLLGNEIVSNDSTLIGDLRCIRERCAKRTQRPFQDGLPNSRTGYFWMSR